MVKSLRHDSFAADPCLFCCCLCCCGLTAISRCLIQESELNPGPSKTSCSPTNLSVRESILIGFQLIVCCTYWWVDREGGIDRRRERERERGHVYDCSEEIIQTVRVYDRLKTVQNRIMDVSRSRRYNGEMPRRTVYNLVSALRLRPVQFTWSKPFNSLSLWRPFPHFKHNRAVSISLISPPISPPPA